MRRPEYETEHEHGFVSEHQGPHGHYTITFVFDPTDFDPEDPGTTTPMMVHLHEHATGESFHATGGCALDMGEVDDFPLSTADLSWLEKQMIRADKLMVRLGF